MKPIYTISNGLMHRVPEDTELKQFCKYLIAAVLGLLLGCWWQG